MSHASQTQNYSLRIENSFKSVSTLIKFTTEFTAKALAKILFIVESQTQYYLSRFSDLIQFYL